ncbi:MAG: hypothetical protein J2P41_05725 [Blastocatellia bacterium]|nr:hypothetical protein [Blastocatellia bacterium]
MRSRILLTIIAAFVIGVIQFVVGLTTNGGAILVCGALMGLLAYGLWGLRGTSNTSPLDLYLPACAAVVGISAGGILSRNASLSSTTVSAEDTGMIEVWAVVLGLAAGGAVIAWRLRRRAARCHICRRILTGEQESCPRCGNSVCRNCWNADAYRCVDCNRSRTPLLAIEEVEWWTERLGDRQSIGRCVRCRHEAKERDLRKCGNCPRAMCVHCWDMENGRCIGCNWVIPDLPQALEIYHSAQARLMDN